MRLTDKPLRVGLVGDFDAAVTAHGAIPIALARAATDAGAPVLPMWLATDHITSDALLRELDAIWCVPASPYRSMDGALRAIRFSRERALPFLGTCAGFQHAIIEYARNVLSIAEADHAETKPDAAVPLVSPLSCSLVEAPGLVRFTPGSHLAMLYGRRETVEEYHCNFGVNPRFRGLLHTGALRISAEDESGDVRAVELAGHPFFVATLFQPERRALAGETPPVVLGLVSAALACRRESASLGR